MSKYIVFICLLHGLMSGEGCPIPSFLHGEFFSLERGEPVDTIITEAKLESQIYTGECNKWEQLGDTGRDETYDVRIIYHSRIDGCYTCIKMYARTPNILQMQSSSCHDETSISGELYDVCNDIRPETEVATLFRKAMVTVNCNETLSGIYQFTYEFEGGGGVCNNANSYITACQSPGSPYIDNQVFKMEFASCQDNPFSVDHAIRYQCLGTWREGDNVFSAVADLGEDIQATRYKCLLTNDLDSEKKRFTMSRYAMCSTLRNEYEGPIRLLLQQIDSKDSPCNLTVDIRGASRDRDVTGAISYKCDDGMYFDDGSSSKQTACNCDSIVEVFSWGECTTPPPATEKPDEAGPRIIQNPENVLTNPSNNVESSFHCMASGYPEPTYKWLKYGSVDMKWVEIDQQMETDFEIGDGVLTVKDPDKAIEDSMEFVCIAENKYGSVRSKSASLIMAYINDFPRSERNRVYVNENHGVALECNPPPYEGFPELMYGWFKNSITNTLDSDENPNLFISMNGRLYFSQATLEDTGNYHCMVFVKELYVSKISMPIPLQVESSIINTSTQIASEFPMVYPSTPLLNERVALECFAYGVSELHYSWEKDGGSLPAKAELSNWNRTLTIINIQMEDTGSYTCTVTGNDVTISQSVSVAIEGSAPNFVEQLQDEYITKGEDVVLTGSANGDPAITYMWFWNSNEINNEDDTRKSRYSIKDNVLTIKSSDLSNMTGMYQLAATNVHGKVFSTAQVWANQGPISGTPGSSTSPWFMSFILSFTVCLFYW